MTTKPTKKPSGSKWLVPFNDLGQTMKAEEEDLTNAFKEVLNSGHYILGQQVKSFEEEFAKEMGLQFAAGVASGTDAIMLALYALNLHDGDVVLTVANSAPATVTAIHATGAKVRFADIDHRGLMDPEQLKNRRLMEGVKVVVPVHLYGRIANVSKIAEVCDALGIPIVEDAAQAAGSFSGDYKIGSRSAAACYSFYPTKNLGAIGDGGLVASNHKEITDRIKLARNYGLFDGKQVIYGFNSRLDELQAAFLRVRLKNLMRVNLWRRDTGVRYRKRLDGMKYLKPSDVAIGDNCHLYTINCEERDSLKAFLEDQGIQTMIHYGTPAHKQPVESGNFYPHSIKNTEEHCKTVLSLPCWYPMANPMVDNVVRAIRRFYNEHE